MNAFDSLPDDARLWLFAADAPISDDALARVRAFLPTWASHGRSVTAQAERVTDSVLAVAAVISPEEFNAGVSGCGIDAMTHAVEAALEATGNAQSSPLAVTYRDAGGAWQSVPRSAFRRLAREGTVDGRTTVLDLTPTDLGTLRARGAARPASEAWHGVTFGLGVAA